MNEYKTIHFPSSRVATFDVGRIGASRHHITGLLEADVTEAKLQIRELVKSGAKVGFYSWILKCIADTIAQEPSVQAINRGRRRQIVFSDVDVSFPLERTVEGKKVPLVALIKEADKKSIRQIQEEIDSSRGQPVRSEKDYVLGESGNGLMNRIFFNLPSFLRMAVWRIILNNPFIRKREMGTVIVTNVGMTGGISGWIIPRSMHNLAVGIGSVKKQPWVVGKEICAREILRLTILFDHDVVDGAPAARFTARLIRNLEKARGLGE